MAMYRKTDINAMLAPAETCDAAPHELLLYLTVD